MIDTRLILIEGPPGSGKSTTARLLADEICRQGRPCQCYYEWSEDHPIKIGDDFHLGEVIASSIARDAEMLRLWQKFAQARQQADFVTVLESRFWQTSAMLMYAAGLTAEAVLESNRQVVEAVKILQPVLIYFDIADLGELMARTICSKEAEWQQAGYSGSWAQHIYDALDPQPWMRQRRLSGLEGALAFFDAWAKVADRLYENLPFPKVKIKNPYHDWPSAMQQMREFLGMA